MNTMYNVYFQYTLFISHNEEYFSKIAMTGGGLDLIDIDWSYQGYLFNIGNTKIKVNVTDKVWGLYKSCHHTCDTKI